MLVILNECRGTFVTVEDFGKSIILIGLLTHKMFFHVWLTESELKVSFSLNIDRDKQIHRLIF